MADDIRNWLEDRGLGKYSDSFVQNEIVVSDLPFLSEADLEKLGLPMGPRKRLLNAITTLSEARGPAAVAPSETDATDNEGGQGPSATSLAERRQLTVMFVTPTALNESCTSMTPPEGTLALHSRRSWRAGRKRWAPSM